MSVEEARKLLGDAFDGVDDAKIQEMIALYRALSRLCICSFQSSEVSTEEVLGD